MAKKKLRFYEKSHKYKVGREEYTSVTRFIAKFFSPFDAKEIARKLAKFPANKQNKRGVRYWLAEWKKSADAGTHIHWLMEQNIKNTLPEDLTAFKDFLPKFNSGRDFLYDYDEADMKLEPEVQLYDEELKLAGTIDLVVTESDGISLIDWKSNKAIKKKSYGDTTAKPPLESMPDCNLSKYKLQLAIYAYMLERQGKVIKDLVMVHLQEDKYETYRFNYKLLKPIVEKMIKWEEKNKQ